VTLTYVTANLNELNGIVISNANTVNLTNVTADGNGTNPPGPNNELGSGVLVNGTGSTIVTVTGGTFTNNRRYGVEIINGTLYEALAPTCSGNDLLGPNNNPCYNVIPITNWPPTLNIPGDITAEATGPGGNTVTFTVTATDPEDDPDPTPGCTPGSGSTFPLGTTTVNCSVTDSGGASVSGSFTVTIQDTTPPALTLPGNITAEATGPSGAIVSYSASANDIVDGPVALTCIPPSGSTFPLGTTTVNCSATDSHGNSVTGNFNVTVQDTTPPVLALPGNITVQATGPAGAVVNFAATASDIVDGPVPVTCTPSSGSTFPIGATTVNCSATDAHGNSASGSFIVVVLDTIGPTLLLPANITVEATGPAGAVVSFTATAIDLIDGPIAVTCTPPSGSTFPLGTTTVNCSATDSHGNSASGSFSITVRDTTSPVLALPSNIAVEATGPAGAIVNFSATARDLVDGSVAVSCTSSSGLIYNITTTTVDCSTTDAHGNTAVGSFTVTVQDTTPPIISLHGNILAGSQNEAGRIVNYFNPLTNDIVDEVGIANCTPPSGSFFTAGTTTVTCTATDAHGNAALPRTFIITVDPRLSNQITIEEVVIPVTGNSDDSSKLFDISNSSCSNSTYTRQLDGMRVTFTNLCGDYYQGLVDKAELNDLRDDLPDGQSYLSGLSVHVLKAGRAVRPLPNDANLSIEFQIPDDSQVEDLAILYWDSTQWVEIDAQPTADGYLQTNSSYGGMFILVKK
jgi:hypothetical protein